MLQKTVWLFIAISLSIAGLGQRYHFEHYGVKDGLANDVVKSIVQDNLGFLYFGTNSGLSVYDGSTLSSLSLPLKANKEPVFRIKKLNDNKLWVTYTGNTHLIYLEKGGLLVPDWTNHVAINNLYENLTNQDLLCTDAGLFTLQGTQLQKKNLGLRNGDDLIHFLIPVSDSLLLVGRKGFSMALINRFTFQKIAETDEDVSVTDIVPGNGDTLFVATDSRGLSLLDKKDMRAGHLIFRELPASLQSLEKEDIFCLTRNESNGNLLIGTTHFGLGVYTKDHVLIFINSNNGLSSNIVRCVFVDRDKNCWIGTSSGVDKLNNSDFIFYDKENGVDAGNIYCVDKDGAGRIWLWGKEHIFYVANEQIKMVSYPDVVEKIALATLKCPDGFWVSVPNYVFFIRTTQGEPRVTQLIPTKDVYRRMLWLDDGSILLGGKQSLGLLKNGQFSLVTDSVHDIRALCRDRFNRIWVGTFQDGIFRLSCQSENGRPHLSLLQHVFDPQDGYNRYLNIFEDHAGMIWAGTRFDGIRLYQCDSSHVSQVGSITIKDGLNNNFITSITQADDGVIWVGTNTGFNKITREAGSNAFKISNSSSYYNFNNPINQLLADGVKNIWGVTDIGAFRLSNTPESRYHFPVYFKEINFPDSVIRLYSSDTLLHFPSFRNSFSVSFTAPFYLNEQQTTYYYRLSHNSEPANWIQISGNHSINFNSLTSGKYVLEIKAIAFNGVDTNSQASLSFIIATPFYRSWWFISLIFLALVGIAYLLYQLRIRQLTHLYSIRDSISKNLHDEIGATLSSINIYSDIARKKTGSEQEISPFLEKIYKGSGQIMESMNDIVWYVNPKNDSWENIIVRMREFAIPIMEAKNIAIRFKADESIYSQKLTMEQRQNVYLIFKEAINNVVKYAQSTAVDIELAKQGSMLYLRVADNGIGFDKETVRKGNGLSNMEQRANRMHGQLTIESAPGKGCKLELRFRLP